MENISKHICQEPSINRLNCQLPYYDKNGDFHETGIKTSWGQFVEDFVIPNQQVAKYQIAKHAGGTKFFVTVPQKVIVTVSGTFDWIKREGRYELVFYGELFANMQIEKECDDDYYVVQFPLINYAYGFWVTKHQMSDGRTGQTTYEVDVCNGENGWGKTYDNPFRHEMVYWNSPTDSPCGKNIMLTSEPSYDNGYINVKLKPVVVHTIMLTDSDISVDFLTVKNDYYRVTALDFEEYPYSFPMLLNEELQFGISFGLTQPFYDLNIHNSQYTSSCDLTPRVNTSNWAPTEEFAEGYWEVINAGLYNINQILNDTDNLKQTSEAWLYQPSRLNLEIGKIYSFEGMYDGYYKNNSLNAVISTSELPSYIDYFERVSDKDCDILNIASLSDTIPLINTKDGYILRYKNMLLKYNWLVKFIKDVVYYRLCLRNNEKRWVLIAENNRPDFFELSDEQLLETLPSNFEEYQIGDVVCVNSSTILFFSYFKTIDLSRLFYTFTNDTIDGNKYGLEASVPYINLPIYLEQEYDSIGLYTADLKFWVPNKKYYLGDIVLYAYDDDPNGTAYKLIKGDYYDFVDVPNEFVKVDDDYFRIFNNESELNNSAVRTDSDHQYVLKVENNGVVTYKFANAYYKGNYDEVYRYTYFDNLDPNTRELVLTHWEKNIEGVRDLSIEHLYDESDKIASGITESSLDALKRVKYSVDISGTTLPFYIGSESRIEMLYLLGKRNFNLNGDTMYCDIMDSISFYKDEDDENPKVFKYGESAHSYICTDDLGGVDYTLCKFNYTIGAQVDENGEYVKSTGVRMEEWYHMFIDEYTCIVDDDLIEKTYQYIHIDYPYNPYLVSDSATKISFDGEQIKLDDFQICNIFKDEDQIGIEDFRNDIDTTIDRSGSACWERHNILGEIHSLQDLENYRNNFFEL